MTDLLSNPTTAPAPSTPAPSSNAAPSTGPGSTGSFPQAASNAGSQIIEKINAAGTAAINQWLSVRGITSSYQNAYLTNGTLNQYAADLENFYSGGEEERTQTEDQLVGAGLLSSGDASGGTGSAAVAALKTAIGNATYAGVDTATWLNQNGSGTASLENQIAAQNASAEKNVTQPIVASVSNPTTLSAAINNAFVQTLGYAPSADQTNAFVSAIQSQDVSYAEAPRAEGKAQLAQAQSEQSALNKLGPDGIKTVMDAYQAAVSGTKLPGAGTNQGPANGTQPTPGAVNPNPAGVVEGPNTVTQQPNEQGVLGSIGTALNPMTLLHPSLTQNNQIPLPGDTTGGTHPAFGNPNMQPAPMAPAGTPGTSPTYGGIFALSPKNWNEAKGLLPNLNLPATAGQATPAQQESAFQAVLQKAYDANGGSWSKAITTIASGSPFGTAEGSHLSNFATNLANEVNDQIEQIQNQINTSTVTTKVDQPDVAAEANLSTKNSDPIGYTASNYSSWAGQLSQMLYGAPSTFLNPTSDTFTGPVSPGEAATATAPTATAA